LLCENKHGRHRIAIIDHGKIVVLDTPEALKAAVGKDRVQIQTPDDEAAIAALRQRFGLEGGVHDGAVTFFVADGEQFVPRLFAELGVSIRSVSVTRPTLDDVFMSYTGRPSATPRPPTRCGRWRLRSGGGEPGYWSLVEEPSTGDLAIYRPPTRRRLVRTRSLLVNHA
jgi:Domain of unknown function (DUF4162)